MSSEEGNESSQELWFSEIIRETDHYYQGEIQQEQRASWILASVGVLLALIVGAQLQLGNALKAPPALIVLTLAFFYLSGIFSIITIIPLRGTKMRRDLLGQSFRRYKNMKVEDLIQNKFHAGMQFSMEDYKSRLFYHFRAHFLRVRRKEYGVVWSSIFLLLGFISLGLVGVFELIL